MLTINTPTLKRTVRHICLNNSELPTFTGAINPEFFFGYSEQVNCWKIKNKKKEPKTKYIKELPNK